MRKQIEDVLRSADMYARTKDKTWRNSIRSWCRLLYNQGKLDGMIDANLRYEKGRKGKK